eukprot:763676-Hanusia_phi.AAC.2
MSKRTRSRTRISHHIRELGQLHPEKHGVKGGQKNWMEEWSLQRSKEVRGGRKGRRAEEQEETVQTIWMEYESSCGCEAMGPSLMRLAEMRVATSRMMTM